MKILGIDASGLAASVAIIDDNILLGEIMTNCKRNHSETLMPMVAELFERLDKRVDDIDFIACTNGPGSFTGLRIGAATAMSLAHGAGKRVIPVPTLDALAYNLYGCANIVVPIMDARRNQVYTAFYDGEANRLTEYMAISIDEVFELLAGYDRPPMFLGDGAFEHAARLAETKRLCRLVDSGDVGNCDAVSCANMNIAPPHLLIQRASAVAALGLKRISEAVTHDEFELLYLRKPQAEREYLDKLASK